MDKTTKNISLYPVFLDSSISLLLLFVVSIVVFSKFYFFANERVDAPTVGKRSGYEPWFWVRLRFFHEAWPILHEGYEQVRYYGD